MGIRLVNSNEKQTLGGHNYYEKIVAILLAVVFVLGSFAGCASNDNVESGKTITVTDMAGNTVELPTNIDKIACQSSTCEAAIITLGKGALLIGTTDYTDETTFAYQLYPELSTVRKCEDDLSVEEMLEANVDVVFVKDTNKIEKYQNAGMKVVCLDFDTVEGTKKSIELLGTILDVTERSNKCLAYIENAKLLLQKDLTMVRPSPLQRIILVLSMRIAIFSLHTQQVISTLNGLLLAVVPLSQKIWIFTKQRAAYILTVKS